jgi:hypothetical protein
MRNDLPSPFAPTSTPKFTSRPPILPPEVTKPCRRQLGVSDGELDRLMAEPILDRPSPCRGRRWPGRSRTHARSMWAWRVVPITLGERPYGLANELKRLRDFPMTATRIYTYTARRMQSEFSSRSPRCFTFHSESDSSPRRRRAPQAHYQTRKQEIQRRDYQYLAELVTPPESVSPVVSRPR